MQLVPWLFTISLINGDVSKVAPIDKLSVVFTILAFIFLGNASIKSIIEVFNSCWYSGTGL